MPPLNAREGAEPWLPYWFLLEIVLIGALLGVSSLLAALS